jgi:hypothetical protein
LDGEPPFCPEVERLWVVACVAKEFGISPVRAARDLDEDTEQTVLGCLALLGYANAKRAYDAVKGDPKKLRGFSEDTVATVTKNTYDLTRLAYDHHAGHKELPGEGECWLCLKAI